MSVDKPGFGDYTYIQGIDGLRAIAVLAVMLFHIDASLLPGGFAGVDLFFVISGYVVSASLAKESTRSLLSFSTRFYARRVVRIFPALVLCLLVVSIVTTLFVPESWLSKTSKYTAYSAFFGASNLALVWLNDGYFSPRVEFNAFTHTWSLGVEEQFYLFFPLLFFVWLRYRDNRSLVGVVAVSLLPLLLVISLWYSWYQTAVSPERAFYWLPSRFWELAFGAMLYRCHSNGRLLPESKGKARLYLLVGVLLVGAGFALTDESRFPIPWALASAGGALFLIAGVVNTFDERPVIQRLLESRVLVYIGKTSYSLYLWHWPVYVLLRWTTGLESLSEIAFAIAATFVLAITSYHLVERPLRRGVSPKTQPAGRIVLVGTLLIVTSFAGSYSVFNAHSTLSMSVTADKRIWYPHAWPTEMSGNREGVLVENKIYVLGDSHVEAYSTLLQQLSDEFGIKIVKLSQGGCGVAGLLGPTMARNKACADKIRSALSVIELTVAPGDIVFLASLRTNRFGDQWAAFSEERIVSSVSSDAAASYREQGLQEAIEIIKWLERLPVHIIIDAPKPIFKSPAFRCSDWFNNANPVCEGRLSIKRDYLLSHREPIMESLRVLADRFPLLIVWDPFPLLCATETCSAIAEGMPLYFDGDHLSAHGNRVLYPSFRSVVEGVSLRP